MKTFKEQARQGDVFLKRVTTIPTGAKPMGREAGRAVLAHGEVTGHAHAISSKHVQQFRVDDVTARRNEEFKLRAGGSLVTTYLEVKKTCLLEHEEHETIQIEPGIYEVRRQREYVRGRIQNVAD